MTMSSISRTVHYLLHHVQANEVGVKTVHEVYETRHCREISPKPFLWVRVIVSTSCYMHTMSCFVQWRNSFARIFLGFSFTEELALQHSKVCTYFSHIYVYMYMYMHMHWHVHCDMWTTPIRKITLASLVQVLSCMRNFKSREGSL